MTPASTLLWVSLSTPGVQTGSNPLAIDGEEGPEATVTN
jgi:hypothetical protein